MKGYRKKFLDRQERPYYKITSRETWNVDDTLAAFIRDLLNKFLKYIDGWHKVKFTSGEEINSFEEYQAKLKDIAKKCNTYTKIYKLSTVPFNKIKDTESSLKFTKAENGMREVHVESTDKFDKAAQEAIEIETKIINDYQAALRDLSEMLPGIWW